MEETTQDPSHSTKFPPGYGDFALKSSDGVVFHFPKFLLEYMSDFFRDMFSLPKNDSQHQEELLQMAEPANVVELFLEYIDPKFKNPPLDPETVMAVLEAGCKYIVPTILSSFVEQAGSSPLDYCTDDIVPIQPFVVQHPATTLLCASEYNSPQIGRVALREMVKLPSDRLLNLLKASSISPSMYAYVIELRQERICYYERLIQSLAKADLTSVGSRGCCVTGLVMWIVNMDREVRNLPTWDTFIKSYETAKCACSQNLWYDWTANRSVLGSSKDATIKREQKLPKWPASS